MKKKIFITFIAAMIICSLIPITAFAVTRRVQDGQTFNLSGTGFGDIVEIDAGAKVTLTGVANNCVQVKCGAGVDLTLKSVTIDNSMGSGYNALLFSGTGNTLNLVNVSRLTGGAEKAGVEVGENCELTIKGIDTGSLQANGGSYGAGIGGSRNINCGTIIIESGTITATGKYGGAGIGSAYINTKAGNITIIGGTITATGHNGGAGIGTGGSDGYTDDNGTINILGGTITATGDTGSAGIGGGGYSQHIGGTINISGGTITATGNYFGSGIGGGLFGGAGTITITGGDITAIGDQGAGIGGGYNVHTAPGTISISGGNIRATGTNKAAGIGGGELSSIDSISITGGEVYAKGDIAGGAQDVGNGNGSLGGAFNISGDSAMFLEHQQSNSLIPTTTTHAYSDFADVSEVPAGYNVPVTWSYPIGAYMENKVPYFTEDATNTSQTILTGTSPTALTANDPNGASDIVSYTVVGGSLPTGITLNSDGTFSGMASKGNYTATIQVRDKCGLTSTTTLNITVNDILVNATPKSTMLGFGETYTLAATTEPAGQAITWFTSDPFVADVDPVTGEVTAGMKEGRVIITAQSTSGYDDCVVYVYDKGEPLPAPSDPENIVTVGIKDDAGNPLAGVYVSLFSEPQTVITDSDGMAVFTGIPYNTNDPHTLIIQDIMGMEIERYSLNFISGTDTSTTIGEGNIDITYNNRVNNTNIMLTMVEDSITEVTANLEFKPIVERVENPETGEDIKPSWWWIFICLVPTILYSKKKHGLEDRF